jgi:hypothetical protein
MSFIVRASILRISLSGACHAASVEEIALLKSANREKILVEGAKKEGKVSLYTGLMSIKSCLGSWAVDP